MDAYTIFFTIIFIALAALILYGVFVFIPLKLHNIMASQLDLSAQLKTAATDLDTIQTEVTALLAVAAGSNQVSPELQADADAVFSKIAAVKSALSPTQPA